jgi:hypothetical protein
LRRLAAAGYRLLNSDDGHGCSGYKQTAAGYDQTNLDGKSSTGSSLSHDNPARINGKYLHVIDKLGINEIVPQCLS